MASIVVKEARPFVCRSCRLAVQRTTKRYRSTGSGHQPEIYDVVTVGGGPVGLALLAALSRMHKSLAVL